MFYSYQKKPGLIDFPEKRSRTKVKYLLPACLHPRKRKKIHCQFCFLYSCWRHKIFTITAEIHARSLANFYGQYADRHMNLKFTGRVSERARARNSTIYYRKNNFTITAEINACSLAKFYGQYADRHMNLKFMRRVSERERAIRPFVIVKNKLMSVFNASVLLLTMNFVITLSK